MDQQGPVTDFSATATMTGTEVVVTVSGEVDMSTADAMFQAATPDPATAATIDLTAVTFFDSAAIHAVVRLAERYPAGLRVIPSGPVRRVLDIAGLADQPWLVGHLSPPASEVAGG